MQYADQLAEYVIGGIKMEHMENSEEMYSGLIAHIQLIHLFSNEVSTESKFERSEHRIIL